MMSTVYRPEATLKETSPLLAGASVSKTASAKQTHPKRTVALVSLLIMFVAGSGSLLSAPQTRLVEDVLCHQFYENENENSYDRNTPIDEHMCKNAVIQSELAYIMGASDSVDAITGLVVVLPYGVLADRIGRRYVLVLSSIGTIMWTLWVAVALRSWPIIPVQTVILGPLLQILGGGTSVLLATAYSLVAEAVSESTRMIAFSRMAVASYVGSLSGGLIAARLMQVSSPWIPLLGSMLGVALGTSLIAWVPETLHAKPRNIQQIDRTAIEQLGLLSRFQIHIKKSLSRVRNSISALPSVSALFVLLVFLGQAFVVRSAGHFFVQYVSKRFHWTLAEAGYLLSIRGITSMVVLLIGLPALGAFLTSHTPLRRSPQMKDLVLARASSLAMTLGALLMGAGDAVPVTVAGQVILTLGDGLIPLCKTILASYVEPSQFSTVYTMVSFVQTAGAIFSGPALAALLSTGMELGPPWLGLPYFGLALICAWILTLLAFVKLPRHTQEQVETGITSLRQHDEQ